jgi:hypothetical protein
VNYADVRQPVEQGRTGVEAMGIPVGMEPEEQINAVVAYIRHSQGLGGLFLEVGCRSGHSVTFVTSPDQLNVLRPVCGKPPASIKIVSQVVCLLAVLAISALSVP